MPPRKKKQGQSTKESDGDIDLTTKVPEVRIKHEISAFDFGDSHIDVVNTNIPEETSQIDAIQKALALNEQMRNTLRNEIQKLKLALRKNNEKQTFLKEIIAENEPPVHGGIRSISCIRAISVFAAPYFRDVKKMAPPHNKDAIVKLKRHDVNAYLKPSKPWHASEFKKLHDGILSYALLAALKPYKRKRDHLRNKLKDQNLSDQEIEAVREVLESTEEEASKIRKMTKKELLNTLDESQIDWFTISSTNLQGTRTPDECEQMYINFLSPNINKKQFLQEEDDRLQQLGDQYEGRDWDTIARILGTGRSAIQCFERYQTKLNMNLKRTFWTPDEDEKLKELVKTTRIGHIIPWNRISHMMPGRTRQQIINRYERSISQQYNRGPWTSEEDALLIGCLVKFGVRCWAKMRPFFQRRSTYAIRERYINALQPGIKMGNWSKEEDKKLIEMIKRYGYGKWSKISEEIDGRTDNTCLNRAVRMLEYSVKYYSDKGIEYNLDENDPELFTRIIKPIPTRVYTRRKIQEKTTREIAIEVFLNALKRLAPYIQFKDGDVSSINSSQLSAEILTRLSDEFHKTIQEQENGKQAYVQQFRYSKRRQIPFKRTELSESESEIESLSHPSKKTDRTFRNKEREWLIGVLNSLFETASKFMAPPNLKKPLALTSREVAETSLYKAYLYKQFHCSSPFDPNDDLQNVVFSGVDYSESLHTVVTYFVQPKVYDGQYFVLAPNVTTLNMFEAIEATESRLQSMSELVRYSKPYVDYLCNKKKESPKCLQCLQKEKAEISTRVSPEIMISDMAEKNFVADSEMRKAACIECADQNVCIDACSCSALEESRESVKLLRQRFLGLFLWPALMSATAFSKEQDDLLCSTQSDKKKDYFWRITPGRKPRNQAVKTQASPASAEPSVSGVNVPKPRAQRKKRPPPPDQIRKSKRLCVINRKSFAYCKENFEPATELQPETVLQQAQCEQTLCAQSEPKEDTLQMPEPKAEHE